MADFSALKQSIQNYIKQNGNKEITGNILQNILLSMVTTMGDGAINDNASDISDIKGDIQNINGSITDINGSITDINGDITDINGDITDLNGDLSDEVNRAKGAEGTLQQNITAEENRAKGAETTTILFSDGKLVFKNQAGTVLYQINVDTFLNSITIRLNTGALYAGYATPSTTPATLTSQKVFYLATQAGTYTHFHFNGGDDPIVLTKDGIYFIVSGNDGDDWNAEPMLQLDDVPTAGSDNPVKSGGVAEVLQRSYLDNKYYEIGTGRVLDDTTFVSIIQQIPSDAIFAKFINGNVFHCNFYTGYPSESTYLANINVANFYNDKYFLIPSGATYMTLMVKKQVTPLYRNIGILFENISTIQDYIIIEREYVDLAGSLIYDAGRKSIFVPVPQDAELSRFTKTCEYYALFNNKKLVTTTPLIFSNKFNGISFSYFDAIKINTEELGVIWFEDVLPIGSEIPSDIYRKDIDANYDAIILKKALFSLVGAYIDYRGVYSVDSSYNSVIYKVPDGATSFYIESDDEIKYIAKFNGYPSDSTITEFTNISSEWKKEFSISGEKYIEVISSNGNNINTIKCIFNNSCVGYEHIEDLHLKDGYMKIPVLSGLERGKEYNPADGSVSPSNQCFTFKKAVNEGDIIHISGKTPKFLFFYSGDPSTSTFIYSMSFLDIWKRFKGLTVICPPNAQYVIYEWMDTAVSSYNDVYFYFHQQESIIVCLGDSLTHGLQSQENVSYPDELQKLIDASDNNLGVLNGGYDGQNSYDILGRQGALPIVLENDVVLPSDTSAVLLGNQNDTGMVSCDKDWNIPFGLPFNYISQYLGWFNPVVIDGIECMITWDGNSYLTGNYYINRLESGESKTLKAGTQIYSCLSRKASNPYATILWIGTNYNMGADFLVKMNTLSERYSNNKAIVLSPYSVNGRITLETIIAEEEELQNTFGLKFFNTRKYLITDALSEAGFTPTTEDEEAIAAGIVPPSLTVDGTHLKGIVYTNLANRIYQKGKLIGYWK